MPKKQESLATDLLKIGKRCAALPDLDKRSADEILGYNKSSAFLQLRRSITEAEAADLRCRTRKIRQHWR